MINADKPKLWKKDIETSVDCFNKWFLECAPKAFRLERANATKCVADCLKKTDDLVNIGPDTLREYPGILPTLRMATCPPIAHDRLVGLAYASDNLVDKMEEGRLPPKMSEDELSANLQRIADVIAKMLDVDIFPWIPKKLQATSQQRNRAATIVADRLCGAVSDPIVRNSQEKRQLACIGEYLRRKGYVPKTPAGESLTDMEPGSFALHYPVRTATSQVSVDVIIQPFLPRADRVPILIEAKSAGDFTNVNKRRKEEARKMDQLQKTLGNDVSYVLFLCGYFGTPYLGYEAAEGIDWIWEHRIEDMDQLGI